jgi:hypothetical protein
MNPRVDSSNADRHSPRIGKSAFWRSKILPILPKRPRNSAQLANLIIYIATCRYSLIGSLHRHVAKATAGLVACPYF